MYEVQSNPALKENNYFTFIPKGQVDKQKTKKLEILLKKAGVSGKKVTEELVMSLPLQEILENRSQRGGKTGL